MRYVSIGDDELLLMQSLTADWQLVLLASDVLDPDGYPRIVGDPAATVAQVLEAEGRGTPTIDEYLLWRSDWGINVLPVDESAAGKVAAQLTAENALRAGLAPGAGLLDVGRTPVIRLRRSVLQPDGLLRPGALASMARVSKEQPPEFLRFYRKLDRSLSSAYPRVSSQSFMSDTYRPRVLALPKAWAWVEAGGKIYPWG